MLNIDSLLKKKGWTGEELGRLEIAIAMDEFKQTLDGAQNPKPLMSKAQFQKMINTLEDRQQGQIYNSYLAIHDWISRSYSVSASQEQQFQLRFLELSRPVWNANIAEDIYRYISQLPAIMTEKQYKETVESRTREILHSSWGTPGFNVFNLLDSAVLHYINELHKNPRKKNPLVPLKKKLEKELVTDPRILSQYNKVMGNGYYTSEDGTRSDSMSSEDWFNFVAGDVMQRDPEDPEIMERHLQIARDMYNGMTEEEAQDALAERDRERGLFKRVKWHLYEDPPKDLNKWEILETGDLFEYYPSLASEDTDGNSIEDTASYSTAIAEEATAFKKEFPSVVQAILKDMERYIKGVSKMPVEEWADTVLSWEDLYKLDAYGFRDTFLADNAIFDGDKRAVSHGIAILKPAWSGHCDRIDEKGYYKAPPIYDAVSPLSLLSYSPESDNYAYMVEGIEMVRGLLIDSLYWINGYNEAVKMVAKYFNVEELMRAYIPADPHLNKLKNFNDTVALLYRKIDSTDYEDTALKEKKLKVLQDVFYPVDLSEVMIPGEKIHRAKGWLRDFKAFTDEDKALLPYLCYRGV